MNKIVYFSLLFFLLQFIHLLASTNLIRENYSWTEWFLHYGAIIGPFAYKYFVHKNPRPAPQEIENERIADAEKKKSEYIYGKSGWMNSIKNELNPVSFFDFPENPNITEKTKLLLWRLLHNTAFRTTAVHFALPWLFRGVEGGTKWLQNWSNKNNAEKLFNFKKKYYSSSTDSDRVMIQDKDKLRQYFKEMEIKEEILNNNNKLDTLYNDIIKIRQIIEAKKLSYFIKKKLIEEKIKEKIENNIANLPIDESFKNYDWIIKNYEKLEKIGPENSSEHKEIPPFETDHDNSYIRVNKDAKFEDYARDILKDEQFPASHYLKINKKPTSSSPINPFYWYSDPSKNLINLEN